LTQRIDIYPRIRIGSEDETSSKELKYLSEEEYIRRKFKGLIRTGDHTRYGKPTVIKIAYCSGHDE